MRRTASSPSHRPQKVSPKASNTISSIAAPSMGTLMFITATAFMTVLSPSTCCDAFPFTTTFDKRILDSSSLLYHSSNTQYERNTVITFTTRTKPFNLDYRKRLTSSTRLNIYAPPGSGYTQPEEEESYYPDTYDPMMEYPGTMRPGRTPENQPFSSLPILEKDPEPVPWPHFQEIEWHHNWGAPHEHPIPMEEFIDMHGRWATAEMEAEMRAGARRNVRERREMEESQKAASFILDDDDDEDDEDDDEDGGASMRGPTPGVDMDLGDGVDVLIGSEIGAAQDTSGTAGVDVEEESVMEEDEEDDDSFLLDLGLDNAVDDSDEEDSDSDEDKNEGDLEPAFATNDSDAATESFLEAMQTLIDAEELNADDSANAEDEDDDSSVDITFDDLGLSFEDEDGATQEDDGGDDEDDVEFTMEYEVEDDDVIAGNDQEMVPLDDMIGDEDMGDDDNFDDGGFDYD